MKKKGFTLVELIVVIAIIGILAVVLIPNMIKYIKNAGLTKQNDAAAKIADQVNILSVEYQGKGITLDGSITTAEITSFDGTNLNGVGSGSDKLNFINNDFQVALNNAVPGLKGKLSISFDDGRAIAVAYQPEDGGYVGLYPNPADRDGSSDTAKTSTDHTFSSIFQLAVDEAEGNESE